jgi:hypothetical protein
MQKVNRGLKISASLKCLRDQQDADKALELERTKVKLAEQVRLRNKYGFESSNYFYEGLARARSVNGDQAQ